MIEVNTCDECKYWRIYDERRLLGRCPRGEGVAGERVGCEFFKPREEADDDD